MLYKLNDKFYIRDKEGIFQIKEVDNINYHFIMLTQWKDIEPGYEWVNNINWFDEQNYEKLNSIKNHLPKWW